MTRLVTFHGIDRASLFDVLLGKRAWDASLCDFVETRFEVDLPLPDASSGRGEFRFSPVPQATCELIVRSRGLKAQQTYSGGHHKVTLPGAKRLETRSRFCFAGFAVEFDGRKFNLRTSLAAEETLGLSDWLKLMRLMNAFHDHSLSFNLRSNGLPTALSWQFPAAPEHVGKDVQETLLVLEAASDIASELSIEFAPFTLNDLASAGRGLMLARHLASKVSVCRSAYLGQGQERTMDDASKLGAYVEFVDFGGSRIAFSVRTQMAHSVSDAEDVWESHQSRRLDIRTIGEAPNDFAEFAERRGLWPAPMRCSWETSMRGFCWMPLVKSRRSRAKRGALTGALALGV